MSEGKKDEKTRTEEFKSTGTRLSTRSEIFFIRATFDALVSRLTIVGEKTGD